MLFLGLESWIVQDGNYADFRVGDHAKFALEFYPLTIKIARSQETVFERLHTCRYRFRGELVYIDPSVWVIDVGIMAYQWSEPLLEVKQGDWVEGEGHLCIDPFFYSSELCFLPGMPALHYDWRIRNIFLETTPWINGKNESGRRIRVRDEQRESFVEVAETNAWKDDGGNGQYILECEKIG
ncbi:MAG: hypothetical protein ACRC8S_12590 [Fimbriiglobus sp.]